MSKTQIPVALRALLARINRKLAHEGEKMRATRSERARSEMGDYYIVDLNRNVLLAQHVDPEQLAREIGALSVGEYVDQA
jgi:hypothetical protein